ncbi:CdiA family toxin C-terminal domain-containing protein [Paenibacillus sp. JJ-223]|uniref:CdiA family toxin C-terminal domain-containing protein n=1 Tax=Paenibacillus sp. JJ-223 TaxID=2905647 RepID=UPI001F477ED1|nr:CdiA family toxin C-terminal domain-containing protein [Paenibacillus sp. JJ-223]
MGHKKKNKTGESASESGKVYDNETGSGSPPKPAKNASESESTNTSRTPSSKTSETDTTTTPKNSTTSKNKPNENESGSPPKPAKNASETEKNNTSRTPSSKTSESDTTKPSTNHTASKNKPNENESESPPKPAKNASESESTNTSRTPSSKTSESDTTTAPKNSTTSKNKNNQDEAPNEVNSWKPKASKKKDEGKPKDDSKPPESSKTDKPKENSNVHKLKEDTKDFDDREDDNWEAQKPMFGEDWDAYFRSKYGDNNVTWVTKNKFEYVDGFDDHLINAQSIVRKGNKGVVGGHNLDSFEKILTDQGWNFDDLIVSKTPHPTIPGVYQIQYRIPALDRELKVIPDQYKNISHPKTVYDPSVISNDQIIQWGKEAMMNGEIVGREIRGTASNGLKFTGYLNENGKVTNFFPTTSD